MKINQRRTPTESRFGSPPILHHPFSRTETILPAAIGFGAYRAAASAHVEPLTPLIATSPSRMRA